VVTPRYRLYSAIHAHALAELRVAGEETRARACHLDWCLSLARDVTTVSGRRRRAARPSAFDDADHDLARALIWGGEHLPARARQLVRLLRRALPDHPTDTTSWGRLLDQLGE
jgi:predicted ATPase